MKTEANRINKRLTTQQLEAIRKRAEVATEGPWRAGLYKVRGGRMNYKLADPPSMADAEFIAHSREDIPALLAEVERLRNEITFILNVDMTKNAYDVAHVEVSVKSWAHRALYGGDTG